MNERRWILVFLLCAALLSGCQKQEHADVAEAVRAGAVLGENIVIDGIPVSGMAVAEARKRLLSVRQEQLQAVCFTVAAGEKQVNCNAADLGAGYDVDEALLQALSLSAYYPAANAPRSIESSFFIDEHVLAKEAERIAEALSFAPQNAAAAYDKTKNAFVYTADQPGQSVSPQTIAPLLAQSLRNGAQERLDVPFDALPAEYTLAHAKADTALVASFSTSFSGKTYGKEGRVFNIEKAAALINGVTLQSGEEFDMNALLGPRTGENGWKEATGIRDAVYVQEYGGGVCQVSSTLYNAVLMADLSVTERVHHSWPLGYIDIGRDATISTGGPNFRFVNSGEVPVTVCAAVDREKKTVSVSIYGRPLPDGISIRVTSKKLETLPEPEVEYVTDDLLKPGEQQVMREPRRGSISVTYKEYYDAEGNFLRREQVTKDKYRSISGITHVGPILSLPEDVGA